MHKTKEHSFGFEKYQNLSNITLLRDPHFINFIREDSMLPSLICSDPGLHLHTTISTGFIREQEVRHTVLQLLLTMKKVLVYIFLTLPPNSTTQGGKPYCFATLEDTK